LAPRLLLLEREKPATVPLLIELSSSDMLYCTPGLKALLSPSSARVFALPSIHPSLLPPIYVLLSRSYCTWNATPFYFRKLSLWYLFLLLSNAALLSSLIFQ
jgi:hypothetical protein